MIKINEFAVFLGIEPTAVSKRLCFVKSSAFDTVWHICDYDRLVEPPPDKKGLPPFIQSVDGVLYPKVIEADSLTAVALKTTGEIKFCEICVENFLECLADVQANPQMRFVAFRTVYEESRNADKPIGGEMPKSEQN